MSKINPLLAPGARVVVRDEQWIVRSTGPEASGGLAVRVDGVSELVRGQEAIFLTAIDEFQVLRPEETELVADDSPRFAKTRLFLESSFRRSPATNANIHLGHQAAINPVDYQLRPTARGLALPQFRFLMADGVGLGKTIEVGVALTELIRRGRGRRILVVAMKSILEQFQKELWGRFTIPLVRLDSVGIQRVQSKIPSSMNPFHFYDRVIISVDTLKSGVYRKWLEDCRWDITVVDECQNIALRTRKKGGRGSQRAELGRLIARQCDSLILTSATPHDGTAKSFASLIRLLEPTAIADEEDFSKEDVEDYFQRKFKKDVVHEIEDEFPEREMESIPSAASPEEDAFLQLLHETTFLTRKGKAASGAALFKTTLLKAFLSSPQACLSTVKNRLAHKDLSAEALEGAGGEDANADIEALKSLQHRAEATAAAGTPKFKALIKRIRSIWDEEANARVVVFSERIPTLEFLREKLATELGLAIDTENGKDQIEVFHGSLDDQAQMAIVRGFGSEQSPIRILLASDAAAEGINLHYFCHHLIHFDLPWSLITLVQRNGRIDRYGQKCTPRVDYLLTVPGDPAIRGDLRVLDRLIEREEEVQKNLGDAAWLMGLYDPEKEEEAIGKAIEGEKSAEDVLPDKPVVDEDSDWFAQFNSPGVNEEPVAKQPTLSLFKDHLAFAREAFEVSVEGHEDSVRWQDGHQGFDLVPPEDLKKRYSYLPAEIMRGRKRMRLTINGDKVQQSLEVARQSEDGGWPEWELFWPHHPVCEWLDDRVLAELGRHQAWAVPLPPDSGEADAYFLFQGVYSNQLSQSILVDWFAIPFTSGTPGDPISSKDVLAMSGLSRGIGNPTTGAPPTALSDLRGLAVKQARSHMEGLRGARMEALSGPLREGLRSVGAWREKSRKRLVDERTQAMGVTGVVPGPQRTRIAREEDEVEKIYEDRKRWIELAMRTVPEPYLRLAAVFYNPETA